jgi:signal transduction histidine kinase
VKIRTRIALSLTVCLLVAGVIVLVVNEAAIESAIYGDYNQFQQEFFGEIGVSRRQVEAYLSEHPETLTDFDTDAPIFSGGRTLNDIFRDVQLRAQRDEIEQTRTYTALAIAVTALAAGLVGWIIARRVLRPARLISERARAASAADLGQRVALEGPNDEMKELSNTFDDMLDRLERSFEAQRRFAAQASHELRTPLSLIRAETELLSVDGADAEIAQAIERIRTAEARAENLVATLLALSRAESGNVHAVAFGLDEVVGDVVSEVAHDGAWSRVRIDLELEDARVVADSQIVECVLTNLLDNALEHNAGDWVRIEVGTEPGRDRPHAVIRITNPAAEADVANMRAVVERDASVGRNSTRGNGIGLTVVELIVGALGGSVELERVDEVVVVSVRVPAVVDEPALTLR